MLRAFIVAGVLVVSGAGHQDQQVDTLRTCLAENTSGKDRKELAKWIFLSIAAHPDMKQLASANAAIAADESSRALAALVTRLLTESCVNETKAVVRAGQVSQAMELAFGSLGELAMRELMADKSVQDSMGLFERHLDQKRFAEALVGK